MNKTSLGCNRSFPGRGLDMQCPRSSCLVLSVIRIALCTIVLFWMLQTTLTAQQPPSFQNDVAPILQKNCFACHNAKKAEGSYRIDTFNEIQKPGDSGLVPISATTPASSEILRRIVSSDPVDRMPFDDKPLPDEQIKTIEQWIAAGATLDGADPNQQLFSFVHPEPYPPTPTSYSVSVPITAMAFNSDGSQLIAGGYHELLIYDIDSKRLIQRIPNVSQRIFSMVLLPSSNTMIAAGGEPGVYGEIRFVDLSTGQIAHIVGRSRDVVLDLAVSPNQMELAIASSDGSIGILNLTTHLIERTITGHADWVTSVAWSDDGSRLATASRDKTCKVFEVSTGNLLSNYSAHSAPVRGIAFADGLKQIISTGSDKMLHRWEVEGAKPIMSVGLGSEPSKIFRSENFVLIPCSDRQLRQFELGGNTMKQYFPGFTEWVVSSSYHPTTGRMAAGSMNGEIRVWNINDNQPVADWIAKP